MKKVILLVLVISSCLGLMAQTGTVVSGVVRDAETRTLLPFVALFFEGSAQGDISNSGGEFSIDTSEEVLRNSRLKVMFSGYDTQLIQLNQDSLKSLEIWLQPIPKKEDIPLLEAIRVMGDDGRKPFFNYNVSNQRDSILQSFGGCATKTFSCNQCTTAPSVICKGICGLWF